MKVLFYATIILIAVYAVCNCTAQGEEDQPEWLTSGKFSWKSSPPFVKPADRPEDPCVSTKDPTIVVFEEKGHLFTTIRSEKRTHQIEYLCFTNLKDADKSERHILTMHPTFFCAPQVFYFTPHKKWYLICQASDESWKEKYGNPYGACFSTSDDISDPKSWTPLVPLGAKPAGTNYGLDFWIICDEKQAYLFFTTLDGNMWREETLLEKFPHGWSEPVNVIKDDIFEASHTYKIKGMDKYLTVVEAQNGPSWRYYKAYTADSLDGKWSPLANTHEKNFASMNNVEFQGPKWSDSISHVELLRSGYDEKMEIDPNNLFLIYQGVTDQSRDSKAYGQIPWKLGVLEFSGK
ncbi:MAG: non-reducing end alpha-L-arabinofuranosidase family hydrolase [Thermoguttaceae bacterium]